MKGKFILTSIVTAGFITALWADTPKPPSRIFDETEAQRAVRNPVVRHGQQGDLKPVGGLVLPMQKPNVSVPVIEIFLR